MWQYDWHEPQALDGHIVPAGNTRNIFEKRAVPLCFTQPRYSPGMWSADRVLNEPLRIPAAVGADRGNEALVHGARRWRETRSLKHEDVEKIALANKRADDEYAEKIRRTGGEKVRWWHTKHALSQRDSLKTVKMSNFTFAPERLVSCKEVVILNLTGCRLGDREMVWVSTFMQQNTTLRRLILQGNKLTAKGVEQLMPGIAEAPNLIEVDFSLNAIGDEGVQYLLQALTTNIRKTVISKIALGACALTPNSTYHLMRLMRDFDTMQCMLLWRNNIGLKCEGDMAGVGLLLEELRINKHVRLLDLSATNLNEASLGKLATDLEKAAREKRLAEADHKRRGQRIVTMSDDVERKRADAIWPDQKMEVHALEKELEAERAKYQEQLDREQKERKIKTKFEKWRDQVMEQTGRELIEMKPRVRLVIRQNPAVTPSTRKRLGAFFDVAETADLDEFIFRRRVFDNIFVPRRAPGEPYMYHALPEPDASEDDVAVAGAGWYDPFRFEDEFERNKRLEKERRKKELEELRKRGYDGGSERYASSDDKNLPSAAAAPTRHQKMSTMLVDEEDVAPIMDEQAGAGEKARRARKVGGGAVAIDMTGGGGGGAGSESAAPSPGSRRRQQHAQRRDDDALENAELAADLEANNARTRAERRMEEATAKLRDQLYADADGLSTPASAAALAALPAAEDSSDDAGGDFFKELANLAKAWRKLDQLMASGAAGDAVQQAEAFVVSEKSRLTAWLADPEQPVAAPASEAHVQLALALVEDMARQPEAAPGNLHLTQALLQRLPLTWGELLQSRSLLAAAAAQGSTTYFHLFLYFADENFVDLDAVAAICAAHPTHRVPLSLLLVQRFEGALALQRALLQDLFADVASLRRELPGEDRGARGDLLATLLGVPELGISATDVAPGDGQSVLTRACLEGDAELLALLAQHGKLTADDYNRQDEGGGLTPLMLAVGSDSADAVQLLLANREVTGLRVDATTKAGSNALDLAVEGGKCKPVIDVLRGAGLTCKADAAKAAAAAAEAEAEQLHPQHSQQQAAAAQKERPKGSRAAMAKALAVQRLGKR